MPITRLSGPLIVPGTLGPPPSGDSNDTPGPSAFAHGVGVVDTRFMPSNSPDITAVLPQWYSTNSIIVLDQVPSQLSAVNLVPAAVPVVGTPMTLATASTGITVLSSAFSLGGGFPSVPSGALVIDGNPAVSAMGPFSGGVSVYDPRVAVSRNVRVTTAGNETGNTMLVVGADLYGVLTHETISLGTAGVYSGKKAFKFFISATLTGTASGSNVSVGTGDVYGFPMASWAFELMYIQWNATLITATTGYTAALALATPSTATTADVRGTYAVQSASDGSKRLFVQLSPAPWSLTQAGLFGNGQF